MSKNEPAHVMKDSRIVLRQVRCYDQRPVLTVRWEASIETDVAVVRTARSTGATPSAALDLLFDELLQESIAAILEGKP